MFLERSFVFQVPRLIHFLALLILWNIIFKNSVRTSQETHYVTATKPNRLILLRETVAVCCENHTEHTNTLCVQNAKF
jgi:hypothetical protein